LHSFQLPVHEKKNRWERGGEQERDVMCGRDNLDDPYVFPYFISRLGEVVTPETL